TAVTISPTRECYRRADAVPRVLTPLGGVRRTMWTTAPTRRARAVRMVRRFSRRLPPIRLRRGVGFVSVRQHHAPVLRAREADVEQVEPGQAGLLREGQAIV